MNEPITKRHLTYLLRLWRADSTEQCWRASLEEPSTKQRIGFASLEQLFAYLMEQVESETKNLKGDKDES